jgi:hypothetical protein
MIRGGDQETVHEPSHGVLVQRQAPTTSATAHCHGYPDSREPSQRSVAPQWAMVITRSGPPRTHSALSSSASTRMLRHTYWDRVSTLPQARSAQDA